MGWLTVLWLGGMLLAGTLDAAEAEAGFTNSMTIAEALVDADKNFVPDRIREVMTLTGVLTSDPLATNRTTTLVHLQDETGGILLTTRNLSLFHGRYSRGDRVQVFGRLVQNRGNETLNTWRVQPLGPGSLPAPREARTVDLQGELYSGQLVRIRGRLHVPPEFPETGKGLLLRDESGEIPVFTPPRILADARLTASLRSGTQVKVTGIAGQNKPRRPFNSGYVLVPRDSFDFAVAEAFPLKAVGLTALLLLLAGMGVRVASGRRIRRRQRKQAEEWTRRLDLAREAQQTNERRLRLFAEQVPAILWTTDKDLRFTSCAGRGLNELGLEAGSLVGWTVREHMQSPEEKHPLVAAHLQALAGEETRFEADWGGRVHECRVEPLRDRAGQIRGVIGLALDASERQRNQEALQHSEQQLLHAQRMEAVGRLAGGVAHDFNNLLMVIRGYCDLLARQLPRGDQKREYVDEIIKSTGRATSLTHHLLAFSRKQVLQFRVVDLNDIVANMNKLLRRLISEHIELVTVFGSDLGRVRADPAQMEQVLMNLAVNAHDAMPRGGKLILETANSEIDEAFARQHPGATIGSFVMLKITDTGCGMDEETRSHIFEPFFTTKDPGKGTGLGLATVYGIVKQSDGNIWVDSGPGQGTTFRIYLPRVEERANESELPSPRRSVPAGSETILVVEDEESVRTMIRTHLRLQGYTVIEARNGMEALLTLKEKDAHLDLLVTDVVMPEMGGVELARRLTGQQPDLRVLYISGYSDIAIHQEMLGPSVAMLEKPITLESLVDKVRDLLDIDLSRPLSRNSKNDRREIADKVSKPGRFKS
ncbi:MAG TPA: ATP-binding protein [Methylomirabilota bacterium]|nr:ATP-binding protein [Methylomirabilota bacterium]